MKADLNRQLRSDEGERSCAYKDSLGLLTIGVGRLIDSSKPGAGLRPDEISYLLNNDIDDRISSLTRALPWFQNLDDARQGCLVNMAFQMGTPGLLAFKNTLEMVRVGKYEDAAAEMLNSAWAQQTPQRAKRLSDQMKTGIWQFAP
jgi:lysozyme